MSGEQGLTPEIPGLDPIEVALVLHQGFIRGHSRCSVCRVDKTITRNPEFADEPIICPECGFEMGPLLPFEANA